MLDFSSLKAGINSLQESIEVISRYTQANPSKDTPEFRTFRAGVIQNFEFTYELSWKAMRAWLAENLGKTTVDGITRKELFRLAAEHKLIENVEPWFEYHYQRNQTPHTYEEKTATEVYSVVSEFLQQSKNLSSRLNEKND